MRIRESDCTRRYVTPEIVKKYDADEGLHCPFCGCAGETVIVWEEIGCGGSAGKPGWGHFGICCRSCKSLWAEKFDIVSRKMVTQDDLLVREKMRVEDIASMEQAGWKYNNDPHNPCWLRHEEEPIVTRKFRDVSHAN